MDAHCHLEKATYGDELPTVIHRARAAGLSHLIAVAASRGVEGVREVIGLVETYHFIYAALGVHPHDAAKVSPADEQAVAELLSHPKVVAVGEIGLDYHYDFSPRDVQEQVFRRMLALAREHRLPIMLHVREAHAEVVRLLDEEGVSARGGVVHCFTGGPNEADAYLNRGLHLSIPGVITFKNAEPLREAVRTVPLERLLVETDSPYLAPIPYRGKRNEPAYIVETVKALATLRGLDPAHIGALTRANTLRLFGIAESSS